MTETPLAATTAVDTYGFLPSVLAGIAQPVWVVDPAGDIRFTNPAAIAAFGYDDAAELEGKPSHETIHYKHPDGTPYPVEECSMLTPRQTGETTHSDEDWFVRRDGTMFPVEYWSAPIETPAGRGAVVAFTDIEERRRLAEMTHERDIAEARATEARAASAGRADGAAGMRCLCNPITEPSSQSAFLDCDGAIPFESLATRSGGCRVLRRVAECKTGWAASGDRARSASASLRSTAQCHVRQRAGGTCDPAGSIVP